MDQMSQLVEQHIRLSDSHLRRIDELMQQAATAQAVPPDAAAQLAKLQLDRTKFQRELEEIRGLSKIDAEAAAKRGEGLTGMLEAMGAEIERILMVFLRTK
ncbi:hypothetical protein JY96_05475 [Aquabacterium sp. NJ1]|uniref:hypothetical protein n=1 Tax=Aquabacterium sp. NJ1 TaxID=1538295 RepID=UPI00052E0966|nr:hypothetical protein [Aquabacterium sp. NJ1]KGM39659.1 hypothetical protein JY96_05475 [Aquabacterium sp. NJ1]